MDIEGREEIIASLTEAFEIAEDVTPADGQPLHALLPRLDLPEPWHPSPTRALTVWEGWPAQRPRFLVDHGLVGEGGQPPRSNESIYLLGESWRQFSFAFPWTGKDPARAIQLWLERFSVERS